MEILSKSKNKLVYKKGNKVYKQFYDIDLYYSELYIFKIKEIQSIIPRLINYDNKKLLLIVEYLICNGNKLNYNKKCFLIGKTLKFIHTNFNPSYFKLINDSNKIYYHNMIIDRIRNIGGISINSAKYIMLNDVGIYLNINDLQIKNFLFLKNKAYIIDFDEFEFSSKYISLIDFFLSNKRLSFLNKKYFLIGYGNIDNNLLKIYFKYLKSFRN